MGELVSEGEVIHYVVLSVSDRRNRRPVSRRHSAHSRSAKRTTSTSGSRRVATRADGNGMQHVAVKFELPGADLDRSECLSKMDKTEALPPAFHCHCGFT